MLSIQTFLIVIFWQQRDDYHEIQLLKILSGIDGSCNLINNFVL